MLIAVGAKVLSGGLYLIVVGEWSIAADFLSELLFILAMVAFQLILHWDNQESHK
jgi:hypothetical protein